MRIKRATPEDKVLVTELALRLWPEHVFATLLLEINEIICKKDSVILLAFEDETAIGFAHGQLRHDYVEGTSSSPVGYLEGIYVEQEHRRHGLARELLKKLEEWAVTQGCQEFASDVLLDNEESLDFHRNSGFKEAGTIVCFTKNLLQPQLEEFQINSSAE